MFNVGGSGKPENVYERIRKANSKCYKGINEDPTKDQLFNFLLKRYKAFWKNTEDYQTDSNVFLVTLLLNTQSIQ